MTAPRVTHLPERGVVRINDGGWEADFQAQDVFRWIRFYKQLRDRKGGKYAAKYQPTIDALEDVLRGMG